MTSGVPIHSCVCLLILSVGMLLLPIYGVRLGFRHGFDKMENRRKFYASMPKPLPRKRRTLSTYTEGATISRTGLFGRLPYELRRMIYVCILGNDLVRVTCVWGKKRFGHFDSNDLAYTFDRTRSKSKVALLKTCRQIYIEAMEVLYTTNTFGFSFNKNNLEPHGYFPSTIRPSRLASITSLRIDCEVDTFDSFERESAKGNWQLLWGEIATKMPGLKELTMRLPESTRHNSNFRFGLEEEWLKPILEVRGLENFTFDIECTDSGFLWEFTSEYRDKVQWLKSYVEEKLCA